MHSDQTRKDGSSESMIQALYYDFVANYVKTRMYSIRYDAAGALRRPTSHVSWSCLLPSSLMYYSVYIVIINVL